MNFLTPLFGLLALLAVPLILLYMLRLRRREQWVSSNFLWRMVLQDQEANRPWQKLRRNWWLLLQLLILLGLVLALARPFLPIPTVANGQIILLLDGSASMQANDVTPSRFAVAQQAAIEIAQKLPGKSTLTVILVGKQPQVLATASRDVANLTKAIRAAQPVNSEPDWSAAFALANGAAASQPDSTTVIISDGGLPSENTALNGTVRYIPIGTRSRNLAFRALSVRPPVNPLSGLPPQLFISVKNYGDEAQSAILSIFFDNQLVHARQIDVPAASNIDVTLEGDPQVSTIFAELNAVDGTQALDDLALDNRAWTVYHAPNSGRVLFTAPRGNLFVEQALASLPDVLAYRTDGVTPVAEARFDLYVYESLVPATLPPAGLMLLAPQAENPWFQIGEARLPSVAPVWQVREHPLNRFVNWGQMQLDQFYLLAPKAEFQAAFQPIVLLDDQPLVWAGEVGKRRMVVLGFDLRASDFPLQVSFPIFMSNMLGWLRPGTVIQAGGESIAPGETVQILPEIASKTLYVLAPNGTAYRADANEQGAVFSETSQPGIYALLNDNTNLDSLVPGGTFVVNTFSALESDLHPQKELTIGQTNLKETTTETLGQREFWDWLVLLALLLLGVEGFLYFRSRLPRRAS